jgi:hypothetical protein
MACQAKGRRWRGGTSPVAQKNDLPKRAILILNQKTVGCLPLLRPLIFVSIFFTPQPLPRGHSSPTTKADIYIFILFSMCCNIIFQIIKIIGTSLA